MWKQRRRVFGLVLALTLAGAVGVERDSQAEDPAPPTLHWIATVRRNAPTKATVRAPKRQVLVFSLFTGYEHKVIPHVNIVFRVIGDESHAFGTAITDDIEDLTAENLAQYDVLVLNNNCSKDPRRNLFLDEMERNPKYHDMKQPDRQAKADALEQSILDFVHGGKGLVAIHGAPTMLNKSLKFTEMVGGAFDDHPPAQELTLRPVDENHPLLAAFRGKGPFVYRDEAYCFGGPYEKLAFRPLLLLDTKGMHDLKTSTGVRLTDMVRYMAWIKPYGQGRVFFCSPSHWPDAYERGPLLQFLLDGVQYAAGDLKCDDTPRGKTP